jgi:hypothetical protein
MWMFLGFAGGYLEVYWRSFGLLFGLCRADLGCAELIWAVQGLLLLLMPNLWGYSGGLLEVYWIVVWAVQGLLLLLMPDLWRWLFPGVAQDKWRLIGG